MLCIPKTVSKFLKDAVRAGEVSIQGLYEMTSGERRSMFEKYAGKELAIDINSAFENAMVSKQKDALKKWAQSVFSEPEKQNANYKDVLDKIESLDKIGALNEQTGQVFLEDLVADKLGIHVTAEEVRGISERAEKLQTEFQNPDTDGLPTIEYWKARKEMDDYISSLTPSSKTKVATSIIGRGNMLFSFKSPLTNIESNTVNGIVQALERRISSGTYRGLNGEFAVDFVKKTNKIYQASGFDISRMETLYDNQKRLGEEMTTSEGTGAVRRVGQWYEDVVFKQMMGAPDVAFASTAFADSANLASTKIAYKEGLSGAQAKDRALEIFKDAVRIDPQTIEGQIVRSQGIADAQYSTYTNKGGYSDLAMAIRTALNKASGDARLGDQLMPFVKTPANVVQAGVDAAGLGAVRGFYRLPDAIRQMKAGNGEPMREVTRLFVRSGLGLTLATVLAYAFNPDDFIGDYESLSQKDRDLAALKNAPFNSIRIGDKYISLDYLGPLAAPFVGIMYARKYGDNIPKGIYEYGRGVVSQALKVPGLREFSDLVGEIQDSVQRGDLGDVASGLTDTAVGYIRARTVPAIVNDVAQATDESQRQTGTDSLSKTEASVPGLRQGLPEKIDQTSGEVRKSEGFLSTLLFGSRVKTANDNEVITEINRLYGGDAGPTIADIARSSKKVKGLQEQIGQEKFQEALVWYGKRYGERVSEEVADSSYQELDDEKKRTKLNSIRDKSVKAMLDEFGYEAPEKE